MFYSRGNRRKHWYYLLSIGRKRLIFLGSVLALVLIAAITVLATYSMRALKYDLERVVKIGGVSTLYDCENQHIASLSGDEHKFVCWEDLPSNLVNAFVAREDETFFEHGGVVYSSVIRSLLRNVASMSYEQGASTITMQLTRNVFEMQDKTLDRKILEAFIARRIEKEYDKDTILTQYLNRIYFGENCYGVGTAAAYYFGKDVSELSLSECATLAGLVRGPSIFNPVVSMKKAEEVKHETLNRMRELDYITEAQHVEALAEPIVLAGTGMDKERPVAS